MKYKDAFERDFGADDSPSNDKKAMDAFDRDFGEEEKPSAKKGKTTKTPDISFLDSYSDIPVPRDLTQEDLRPYGAGLARGGRNVGESIGNAEMWAANKLGVIPDTAYGDVGDIRKNRLQDYQKNFGDVPTAGLGLVAGELLAGLPIGGAIGKLAGTAIKGTPVAVSAIDKLQDSGVGNFAYNALRGGAAGAGGNSLVSAGSEAPLSNQLMQGAAIGAGIGGGLPLIVGGAGYLANKASNILASPEEFAMSKVAQAAQRDNIPLDELKNQLTEMGDNAKLPDVAGRNMLRLADTVGNVPGQGQEKIAQFLNERQSGQNERLMNATAAGLKIDPNVNYEGNIANLIEQRKDAAAPLYKQAFDASPVTNDRIEQFIKDPVLQSGLKKGLQIQRLESLAEGKPFNPSDYAIKGWEGDYETGNPILEKVPNMRLLDSAKKGLDSIIAENTDNFGKVNEYGRAVTKVKNAYLKELDSINPDYSAARSSYSEPSQSLNAIEKGSKFVKNGSYGNAQELAKMSDADKQFFRIGAGKAISDLLDGTREGSDAASKLFATPKMQKALESVFPTKKAFDDFSKTVKDEIKFYSNRRAILGGSPTAPRLAAMNDAGQEAAIDFGDLASAARGNYGRAALNIGSKIKNKLTQMSPEKANAITDILFAGNQGSAIDNLSAFAAPRQPNLLQNFVGSNYFPVANYGTNNALSGNRRK